MLLPLIIFLIALLPVALRAWMGWNLGATREIRYLLTGLFASLVALRYWYLATMAAADFIPLDPRFLAVGVFGIIFSAAWILASLTVNLNGEFYQSVLPNPLDKVLGAVSGLLSGAVLGGSLLLVLAVGLTGKFENFDTTQFPVRLDQFPIATFQMVEQCAADVPAESAAHTWFPQLEKKPALVWK